MKRRRPTDEQALLAYKSGMVAGLMLGLRFDDSTREATRQACLFDGEDVPDIRATNAVMLNIVDNLVDSDPLFRLEFEALAAHIRANF